MQKSDLDEIGKLVRKIVREEVTSEVGDAKSTLDGEIRLSRMHLQSEIRDVKDRIKNLDIKVHGELEGVKKEMNKLHKDLKKEIIQVSYSLDKQTTEVAMKVKKLEQHLNLPQN